MLPQSSLIVVMDDHGPIPVTLIANPRPAIANSMPRKQPTNLVSRRADHGACWHVNSRIAKGHLGRGLFNTY